MQKMKSTLIVLGFLFFAIELLIGGIYGLSLVPWGKFISLFTEKVLLIIFVIVWNIGGAIFLWAGYDKR